MKTKFEKRIVFDLAHVLPRKYKNLHNVPHWHKEHELILVQSGEIRLLAGNDRSFVLNADEAAFLHSEEVHSIESSPEAVVIVVKLDPSHFHRIIGEKRLESPLLYGDYALSARLSVLFSELKEPLEYSGIVADSIMTELIARIFRQEATQALGSAHRDTAGRFKDLLALIGRDYAYMTFDDAAEYMHFSKPYFSEFFSAHAGMTFTRYLNMTKIAYAAERVLEGKLSITEISKRCGFNTIRNFNRVFKELTGYPPSHLPKEFRFTHSLRDYTDSGFDPTLLGSEILET